VIHQMSMSAVQCTAGARYVRGTKFFKGVGRRRLLQLGFVPWPFAGSEGSVAAFMQVPQRGGGPGARGAVEQQHVALQRHGARRCCQERIARRQYPPAARAVQALNYAPRMLQLFASRLICLGRWGRSACFSLAAHLPALATRLVTGWAAFWAGIPLHM
jgi:hypothetical protein